ncbi:MAG: beta-ketoacyl-[acyl-carrier-protein] synthase family protein [Desulfobulbaceae bacterium]|jgi:3-oxoacyl-[acyl-carrier-protein] synthase II|nr:beta-ketoacyl-[acyl-carrier-protein] synthase family protein [Desulfobulbaceae bacterium]
MPDKKIVILAYDAISPLGTDLSRQWSRLCLGESGVGPLTRFALTDDFPTRIAGQIPEESLPNYPFLSPRHQAAWFSPIFRYGMLTAVRALENSGLLIDQNVGPRVAVTYSSAIGGLDALLQADRQLVRGKLPHPYANPNSCINMIGGKIAIETGATGPIFAPISACATGLSSIVTAAMLIMAGRADAAICGAVDCPLVEPICAGFYTMNGCFHEKDGVECGPEAASRPFAVDRRGFVISEGAGAVIIASDEFAKAHGLSWRAELRGWSMTSDAHHFVAPHVPTVARCMAEAIADAGLAPADIDAINAHATSTKAGDLVEYQALRQVFGVNMPPISANKSQIGHCMGAASVVESILALLALENALLPPTINYRPDPEIALADSLVAWPRRLDQRFILKNAFGFGGCNACAVFARV